MNGLNAVLQDNNNPLDNIPYELIQLDQWVNWESGTKVPINSRTGDEAKSNEEGTWSSFNAACNYGAANQNNGIEGIGFVVSKQDPYCGIDLDKCINPDTLEIEQWAQKIIELFNSYTEISPSGRGIHIFIKGKKPGPGCKQPGPKCKQPRPKCKQDEPQKIEIYDSVRFFTITGDHLDGTPATIEPRQAELEIFYISLFSSIETSQDVTATRMYEGSLTDTEIIEKAMAAKNGYKFQRLCGGDTSDYDSDNSRADLALCGMLAFWCNDPGRIDQLFRQSGLYRPKWDSKRGKRTYGEITIAKAISQSSHGWQTNSIGSVEVTEPCVMPPVCGTGIPRWPEEVMAGAAGRFSKTYSEYIESPQSFLFMDYLTILGHVISGRISLDSELETGPRLYVINLGESADTRKSTALTKTSKFFKETLDNEAFHEAEAQSTHNIDGVGSAEGLVRAFQSNHRVLLVTDELHTLVQKMKIDSSVLSGAICSLFESNIYQNVTKKSSIKIDNAELCILGACTLDTYEKMFTPHFLDIGLLNRFFVVIGGSVRKFSIPKSVPSETKEALKKDLVDVLRFVDGLVQQNGHYSMPISPGAMEIFDEWYMNHESSVFAKRLDTYGHRLMSLLAVNEMVDTITPEIAEKTILLLNYQIAARKFADPIDADNNIAKLEEKIRRIVALGPIRKRDLERKGNKNRSGSWMWTQAIKNLLNDGEIVVDKNTHIYSEPA